MSDDYSLVTAQDLERIGVLKKGTAYRMVAVGQLPHYLVGCRGRGIRFRLDEVLAALRRPTTAHEENVKGG